MKAGIIFLAGLAFLCITPVKSQNVAITNDAAFTTPQSPLHLYWTSDGNLLQLSRSSAANTGLLFSVTGNNFSINNRQAGLLSFYTNNTERLRLPNSAQIQAVGDGTAAAPAWSFVNNTGIGIWRAGSNILAFSTNGIERVRVDANGLVGINMTPSMMLDVTWNTTTNDNAVIRGTATGEARVYGVYGTTNATTTNASGVFGYASGATGAVNGVWGTTLSSGGAGVFGLATLADGDGVVGLNSAATGAGFGSGVYGESSQTGAAGVLGYGGTTTRGVLGLNDNDTYAGVHGQNSNATGIGVLGVTTGLNAIGTYGYTNQTGAFGVFGVNTVSSVGVYGRANGAPIYIPPNSVGAGGSFTGNRYGAYATQELGANGTAYSYTGTYAGLIADAWDGQYHFGVHGYSFGTTGVTGRRTGGVLGSHSQLQWGSLGYRTSANANVGVYGSTAYSSGAGKSTFIHDGIGVAGFGSLFGSVFRGEIYGMAVKGERYSLYVDGRQYTNNIITQINEISAANERVVSYVPTSLTVDVHARGVGTIINGEATLSFEKSFREMVSDSEPVIVTVTPIGRPANLYIDNTSKNGFKVIDATEDLQYKNTNLTFTWIAVGVRKGYENPSNPVELLSKDYDIKLDGFLFNDSDTQNEGTPMWWDGQSLRYDTPPQIESIQVQKNSLEGRNLDNNSISLDKILEQKNNHSSIKTDRINPGKFKNEVK